MLVGTLSFAVVPSRADRADSWNGSVAPFADTALPERTAAASLLTSVDQQESEDIVVLCLARCRARGAGVVGREGGNGLAVAG